MLTPGVYVERTHRPDTAIRLVETHHVCFLGCTERGPLNEPVPIRSPKMFIERFGEPLDGSYLGQAVAAFFLNGGDECSVLRVAHAHRFGTEEVAASARAELRDLAGELVLSVRAESPGVWGDGMSVTLTSGRKPVTGVLMDVARRGVTAVELSSAYGLARGMTLVFNTRGREPLLRVIAGISGRTVVWEEPLEYELVAQETRLERLAAQITIDHGDRSETYEDLALVADGKGSIVSEVNSQSRLIRVALPGLHSSFEGTATGILSGGSDGRISLTPADYIGRGDEFEFKTGLAALADRDDVNVIVCPDLYPTGEWAVEFGGNQGIIAVWRAVLDHCERYPNRFALIDPPPNLTAQAAAAWRTQFDSAFGATYYPWVELVTGASDLPVDQEVIPPSGPVSGLLAKRDREDGVHHAAANAELYGVVRLAQRITYKEQEILNPFSVNCLRVFPGRGVRPYGARTLSSDASWRYVNVRRSASAIAHSIYLGTQWAVFEPNDRSLEKKLVREASAFLAGLWRTGYMQGDSPSESFYVRCDASTTSRAQREAGQIIVEIGLALAHPAEFIVVRFAQQTLQKSTG
jgi:hypothetical protein